MPFKASLMILGLPLLLALSAGCDRGFGPVGKSVLSTEIDGRKIRGTFARPASVHAQKTDAVFKFNNHQVLVTSEAVLLDEVEVAKIPAEAKQLELNGQGGKLTVTADGKSIGEKPF